MSWRQDYRLTEKELVSCIKWFNRIGGFLFVLGLIALLLWDQIDCLISPGTDWCLGCVEDCLDPLVDNKLGED